MNKQAAIGAVVGVLALAIGIWKFKHREKPDITEDQAKIIASESLEKFCSRPIFRNCADFSLAAEEASRDKRFKWSFRYENVKPEPAQRIVVDVGRKGDKSVSFSPFTAIPGGKPWTPALPVAAAKPAASPGQPAPPLAQTAAAKPGAPPEAPMSLPGQGWTLCELPPVAAK